MMWRWTPRGVPRGLLGCSWWWSGAGIGTCGGEMWGEESLNLRVHRRWVLCRMTVEYGSSGWLDNWEEAGGV